MTMSVGGDGELDRGVLFLDHGLESLDHISGTFFDFELPHVQ